MKKLVLFYLTFFLISISIPNFVLAELFPVNCELNRMNSSLFEGNDIFTERPDTITCPPPPYTDLIPEGAHMIGTDTIITCIYDTISVELE